MSSPLKILELRDADGPGGGPEKTVLYGTALTDPARYDISVCYIRPSGDRDETISHKARELNLKYTELRQRGKFDRRVWRELRQFVKRERFDIVHSHDYKTDGYNLLLAKFESTIPLTTAHGWSGDTRRERWLYYPAHKRLLRFFPLVISVSSRISDTLKRYGVPPERIRLIPNSVDAERFRRDPAQTSACRERWNFSNDDFVIGGVGRLEPLKCFDLLIEAFAPIYREFPNARLLIAGEGSQRASLEALAEQLGVAAFCRFIGHCPAVTDVYHALDVYVQSSDTEGTPNVVLEAMAMEVPVVATDAGGTTDVFTPDVDGLLVATGDAKALTAAIRRSLQGGEECRRRTLAARRHIETELTFSRRMAKVEGIYDTLAAGQRPSRKNPFRGPMTNRADAATTVPALNGISSQAVHSGD